MALYFLPSLIAKLNIYTGGYYFLKDISILALLSHIFTKAFFYTHLDIMQAWKHFPVMQINVFFLANESGKAVLLQLTALKGKCLLLQNKTNTL